MILSKMLKLPIHKINRQTKVINIVHVTKSRVMPNNIEAREAVTMVTAVCMVNIVAKLRKKNIHK